MSRAFARNDVQPTCNRQRRMQRLPAVKMSRTSFTTRAPSSHTLRYGKIKLRRKPAKATQVSSTSPSGVCRPTTRKNKRASERKVPLGPQSSQQHGKKCPKHAPPPPKTNTGMHVRYVQPTRNPKPPLTAVTLATHRPHASVRQQATKNTSEEKEGRYAWATPSRPPERVKLPMHAVTPKKNM